MPSKGGSIFLNLEYSPSLSYTYEINSNNYTKNKADIGAVYYI